MGLPFEAPELAVARVVGSGRDLARVMVAQGRLWGSGLSREWGFGEMYCWMAWKQSPDGVMAGLG